MTTATRTLAVRLDSDGDVLLTGPAVRALAAVDPSGTVDLLASPQGAGAAGLLPGVGQVLRFAAPWSGFDPPPVDPVAVAALVRLLAGRRYERAIVFTSFHQSPLPMALLARLAGIGWVGATSEDYPGSLLDLRHRRGAAADGGDLPEAEAALDLARSAGGRLRAGDDGRLAVRRPLPDPGLAPDRPYVVLHPGASVPSRAMDPGQAARSVRALAADGWAVVVTGSPGEIALTARVTAGAAVAAGTAVAAGAAVGAGAAGPAIRDLGGRTDLGGLGALLAGAACVVVGNTGPAHLAAAVGTPVVSLFSPVVPARRWAPWGVPSLLLGNQHAACRGSRARECPVPGHPCLAGVDAQAVVRAVRRLTGHEGPSAPPATTAAATPLPATTAAATPLPATAAAGRGRGVART